MYKYSKRNNQQEFSSQPASISSEFSPSRNFAGANFRYGQILPVRIFAMAKFRQNEISLQLMRNFAKITAKFRLTQRKFASALTKIRSEISPNFRENKERKTTNFVCISFAQYCTIFEAYLISSLRFFVVQFFT